MEAGPGQVVNVLGTYTTHRFKCSFSGIEGQTSASRSHYTVALSLVVALRQAERT
jgi:hypothetical protein